MRDPALEQLHKLPGRTDAHRLLELGHHRSRRARPLHALPVAEETARPQPAIHLGTQRPQIAARARRDQPHPPLDILVRAARPS